MRRCLLALAVVVLAACRAPAPEHPTRVDVTVRPGIAMAALTDTLAARNVITDPLHFRFLAWFYRYAPRIRPGRYRFTTGTSALLVLKMLSREEPAALMVTIPEGLTMDQTAGVLAAAGVCDSSAFLAACSDTALLGTFAIAAPTAEGYLFPETYELSTAMSPSDVVRILLRQFTAISDSLRSAPGTLEPSTPRTLSSAVTLASIVEEEAQAPADYPRIAGVFVNRLNRRMPLQSDATVEYALPRRKEQLTIEDMRVESPYNTFLQPGLPPGPICSPGRRALAAALNPEKNDYLFFVTLEDGTTVFTRTFAEHEAAIHRAQPVN